MSAEAIAKLAQLWEQLNFARTIRTVGRMPEDVLTMEVEKSPGITDYYVRSRRLSDVPESDRDRVRISWRHYFGFADNDAYFNNDANCQIDYDIEMTLWFGDVYSNHRPDQFRRPAEGTLICGVLEDGPKGPRFKHWFICDEELLTLVRLIRGEIQPEGNMKSQLTRDGHLDRRDLYWAIAQLVMFDNVELFATKHLESKARDFWDPLPASEDILCISHGCSEFVHALSYTLEQPQWWQKLLELVNEVEDPETAQYRFDMDQMMGKDAKHPDVVGHSMQCRACEPMRQTLFEREEALIASYNAGRTSDNK